MALAGSLQSFSQSGMIIALKKSVGGIMVPNMQIQIDLIILSQKNLEVTEDLEKLVCLVVTDSRAFCCIQISFGPEPKLLPVHFPA